MEKAIGWSGVSCRCLSSTKQFCHRFLDGSWGQKVLSSRGHRCELCGPDGVPLFEVGDRSVFSAHRDLPRVVYAGLATGSIARSGCGALTDRNGRKQRSAASREDCADRLGVAGQLRHSREIKHKHDVRKPALPKSPQSSIAATGQSAGIIRAVLRKFPRSVCSANRGWLSSRPATQWRSSLSKSGWMRVGRSRRRAFVFCGVR